MVMIRLPPEKVCILLSRLQHGLRDDRINVASFRICSIIWLCLSFRKFGTSRRLGETDKKDMAEMIGIKIQLSKEEWRHELDSIREQLNIVTCELSKKDKDANKVADKLNAFIHVSIHHQIMKHIVLSPNFT